MVKFSEAEIVQNIFTQFKDKKINLLAPVVRGRKGHYRELFEEIRKKGFVKARVDGEIIELRPKFQVDRYKIHDIEIVVDRIPITDAMKTRLGESVAQCLKMGNDLLFLLEEGKTKVVQFSKQLMCLETSLSYEEPSPNSFSFNSPYGACPVCKGLGNVYAIDLNLIMPDNSLSVNAGGIAPLGEAREASVFTQVKQFARKHKISLDKPMKDLSKEQMDLILFGDKNITNSFDLDLNDEDIPDAYTGSYEGIVPMLKRWFTSSQSTDHLKGWVESFMELNTCSTCNGTKLRKESLWFKVNNQNIAALNDMHLDDLQQWFLALPKKLDKKDTQIAAGILKEIDDRISFLMNVGLSYLSLSRPSKSLSGGESQRIRLATQIGSQLQGITYILDEPSIGLHQRDNQRLITALKQLRDIGNSVLVVEHDKDIMMASDYLVDIGPRAGIHGGHKVAQGTVEEIKKDVNSLTGKYLSNVESVPLPERRRKWDDFVEVKGARQNNLRGIDVKFPLHVLSVVTGVSGSGKTTLVKNILFPSLQKQLGNYTGEKTGAFDRLEGNLKSIKHIEMVDQNPIGKSSRSNPITYIKAYDAIRDLYANLAISKGRGYKPQHFSFNVDGGRCETCQGEGEVTIEMQFMADIHLPCEECSGARFKEEILDCKHHGKHISDVLNMSIDEALEFFKEDTSIYNKIKPLQDVGLGYVHLGQSSNTLSGGEAQRVKLASFLGKGKSQEHVLFIFDEPTTGLHFNDIKKLMDSFNALVNHGHTIIVIEHNMDIIKCADWVIDLGPEAGTDGGNLVFEGIPEDLVKEKRSYTGAYLEDKLKVNKEKMNAQKK
jgi:excinuclease ABC subunit A